MEHFRENQRPFYTPHDTYEQLSGADAVIETRALLDELDEEALKDIFERELTRSGVEFAQDRIHERFVPLKQIIVDGRKDWQSGVFIPDTKEIKIFSQPIDLSTKFLAAFENSKIRSQRLEIFLDSLEAGFLLTKEGRRLKGMVDVLTSDRRLNSKLLQKILFTIEVVHVLVHEELHALTLHYDHEATEDDGFRLEYERKSLIGVRSWRNKQTLESGDHYEETHMLFGGINEGITELIARRLSQEFLNHTLPKEILSTDIAHYYNFSEYGAYNRERWVSEQLVVLYSAIAEVPRDVVEKSVFRTYLNGDEFIVPYEIIQAVQHDIPELGREHITELYFNLVDAISEDSFSSEETDINVSRVFKEFINLLPQHKQIQIKDAFQELFYKYSFSKELQDGVVEK